MENVAHGPDEIDRASAEFWHKRTLAEQAAHVTPIMSWDEMDIADLTDAEREAFAAALDE